MRKGAPGAPGAPGALIEFRVHSHKTTFLLNTVRKENIIL